MSSPSASNYAYGRRSPQSGQFKESASCVSNADLQNLAEEGDSFPKGGGGGGPRGKKPASGRLQYGPVGSGSKGHSAIQGDGEEYDGDAGPSAGDDAAAAVLEHWDKLNNEDHKRSSHKEPGPGPPTSGAGPSAAGAWALLLAPWATRLSFG